MASLRNSFPITTGILATMICVGLGLTYWVGTAERAIAQNTAPPISSVTVDPYKKLEDQLRSRLRATTRSQIGYIQYVVKQVKDGRLDMRLVIAVERYAIRRRSDFPFPFFEQAMGYEAAKRNVILPKVKTFATTKVFSNN